MYEPHFDESAYGGEGVQYVVLLPKKIWLRQRDIYVCFHCHLLFLIMGKWATT